MGIMKEIVRIICRITISIESVGILVGTVRVISKSF